MSIVKEFIPFEQALALKELGFDKKCLAYFDANTAFYPMGTVIGPDSIHFGVFIPEFQYPANNELIAAPLYQQAFDWFRSRFNLDGKVISWTERGNVIWHFSSEPVGKPSIYRGYVCTADSHEIAQLELLNDLIKQAKNIKNG